MRLPGRISLRSFSARIVFLVFSATVITSLTVTLVSTRSIDSFLRAKIDQKFPTILTGRRDELELWYDQRLSEMDVFSSSVVLLESVARSAQEPPEENATRAQREIELYLDTVIGEFPQYETLFVLDAQGRRLASVGEPLELAPSLELQIAQVNEVELSNLKLLGKRRLQLASAHLEDPEGRHLGSIHARLRLAALEEIMHSTELSPSGTVFLVGADGRCLTPARHREIGDDFGRPMPSRDERPPVEDYWTESDEHVVGTARPIPRFGWTVVVEELYDEAFAPVVASIRRVLALNLAIVLGLGIGAFRIAISVVRPIEALSRAARRISEGEDNVELPESRRRDEIGLLTNSFSRMMQALKASRHEVEQANERLQNQNQSLQQANEVLEQLSITDGLTKLHNHRFFQDFLVREAKRASRTAEPLTLILIDIDHFKRWNDRLGHAGGDEILRRIASLMSGLIRDSDLLARYGGEEFALLLPNTPVDGGWKLAEKIRAEVVANSSHLAPEGVDDPITVSIGVAAFRGDRAALFNAADQALYRAKAAGRDCVMVEGEE